MTDEEKASARQGREAGLRAARDAFYRCDIARKIVRFHEENGGLLTMEDLASFSCGIEPPAMVRFSNARVYGCGPWCQGPALLQMLKLAEAVGIERFAHNSPDYVHVLTELMKLAFADREAHIADPRFRAVPLDDLLSDAYVRSRARSIDLRRAHPGMPQAGPGGGPRAEPAPSPGSPPPPLDTSYVCVVDQHGNVFSATPSDVSSDTPVIPGTGLCPSSRGSQSWADPSHPAHAEPGKRPRLTPNPALALLDDGRMIPF